MAWTVEFSEGAQHDFARIATTVQRDVIRYLERVTAHDNPRDFGKPLRGDKAGVWRYRTGKFRILCRLEDQRLVVLVLAVGKRDEIYD